MLQIAKYARRIAFFLYARFFSPFVLGICSFLSVMIDVCLVSYNVLQVCHCFIVTLNKKGMYTDLQTTILCNYLWAVCCTTSVCP